MIFNMFETKNMHFLLSVLLFWFLLCGCTKTFNVKAKQSNYKVVKASLGETSCMMSKINFQKQKGGVFISKDDLTLLTNNINYLQICYSNLLKKSKTNLVYYEDIIKTLGGEFVDFS